MMEQVSQTKQKPMAEWFKPGTPAEAISLVISLLQFNPLKRPTAVDILRSSYLASFSNPKQEIESRRIIKPPISDNTKLSLKDYRIIIYDHIRKVYRERDGQLGQSESNKKL